ncbi:MAG: hypothetical protein WCL00_01980 [Bacteroidota bacterium]
MKKGCDLLVNVLLPLVLGFTMYHCKNHLGLKPSLVFYLPDGLWAYSFISFILIIWHRKIHIIWIILVFFIYVLFEILQYFKIIPGTGDIMDIFTYFGCGFIALMINQVIREY